MPLFPMRIDTSALYDLDWTAKKPPLSEFRRPGKVRRLSEYVASMGATTAAAQAAIDAGPGTVEWDMDLTATEAVEANCLKMAKHVGVVRTGDYTYTAGVADTEFLVDFPATAKNSAWAVNCDLADKAEDNAGDAAIQLRGGGTVGTCSITGAQEQVKAAGIRFKGDGVMKVRGVDISGLYRGTYGAAGLNSGAVVDIDLCTFENNFWQDIYFVAFASGITLRLGRRLHRPHSANSWFFQQLAIQSSEFETNGYLWTNCVDRGGIYLNRKDENGDGLNWNLDRYTNQISPNGCADQDSFHSVSGLIRRWCVAADGGESCFVVARGSTAVRNHGLLSLNQDGGITTNSRSPSTNPRNETLVCSDIQFRHCHAIFPGLDRDLLHDGAGDGYGDDGGRNGFTVNDSDEIDIDTTCSATGIVPAFMKFGFLGRRTQNNSITITDIANALVDDISESSTGIS